MSEETSNFKNPNVQKEFDDIKDACNTIKDEINNKGNNEELNNLLNNFNLESGDINNMIKNFSKGGLENIMKDFSNIIAKGGNSNNNCNSNNFKNEKHDSVVIDPDSSDDGIKIESGEDLSHCDDDDFELDLNKYFIASNGSNFCDILLGIKNELVEINKNLNKK